MKAYNLLILLILLSFLSCDAPRENPFDPQSPNYFKEEPDRVLSKIVVKHLYPPFNPISNVQIIEPNLQLFGVTNAKGEITFEHLPADSLTLIAMAERYFPDTLTFAKTANNEYEIFLNAKPQIEEFQLKSFYNNIYPELSITSLYFSAIVNDLDGPFDISVTLHNPEFYFDTVLVRDINNSNLFTIEFNLQDISKDLTPQEVPELNFNIIVKNMNNDSIITDFYSIKRVIAVNLKQLSPTTSQVVRDSVVFKWVDPELPYGYSINIVLLTLPTFKEIVYKGIPKGETSFVLKNLSPGQYNWKLQVEDKLGNICQSNYINFYYEQ